jgi:C4-dicarboxylate-specific signal transduction histidine kinase
MNQTPDEAQADFYDAIVGQLRQPLTTIRGGVQRAKRLLKTDPSVAEEALDQVVTQIARMNMMLIELRDRARDAAYAEELFKR